MNRVQRKQLDMDLKMIRNNNFKRGEPDGFNRALGITLYAIYDITGYETEKIMKLWDDVKLLDEEIKSSGKQTSAAYKFVHEELFEKYQIITSDEMLKKAEQAAPTSIDKEKKELLHIIDNYKDFSSFFRSYDLSNQKFRNEIEKIRMDAAYDAYLKGSLSGFFRCVAMFLYSLARTSRYKKTGLMKIYNLAIDIDTAIMSEDSDLTDELIYYALYEETDIICSENFAPYAEAYAEEYAKTGEIKGYKAMVQTELDKHYALMRKAKSKKDEVKEV